MDELKGLDLPWSIDSAVVDYEIVFIQTCTAGEIHKDF